jgi:hypothetical protein
MDATQAMLLFVGFLLALFGISRSVVVVLWLDTIEKQRRLNRRRNKPSRIKLLEYAELIVVERVFDIRVWSYDTIFELAVARLNERYDKKHERV